MAKVGDYRWCLGNGFGFVFWRAWGRIRCQGETYSDTKYDVSMGEDHGHSRLNSKAKNKQAEFKLKFECSRV